VQYFNKIDRYDMPFNTVKLFIEVGTSGFVGIISFELCDAAGFSWQLTAALVAISGHMGARALILIENQVIRRFTNGNSERGVEEKEETRKQAACKKES